MENNTFSRFVYTIVHGSIGVLTWFFLGGILYSYCKIACAINPKKNIYKEFAFLCKSILWVLGTGFVKIGKIPEGEENFIVVSNHTNWMDAFFICAFFNGTPGVVFLDAKMFKYPILKYFLKKVGAIAINKKDKSGKKSLREIYGENDEAIDKSENVLQNGTNLFIFPEGTRTPDGKLLKFKYGAAKLAIKARKRILPLGLSGSYEFSNKKSWLLNPGKIVLHAGDIIEYSGVDKRELTTIMEQAVLECVEKAKRVREEYFMLSGIAA